MTWMTPKSHLASRGTGVNPPNHLFFGPPEKKEEICQFGQNIHRHVKAVRPGPDSDFEKGKLLRFSVDSHGQNKGKLFLVVSRVRSY